MIFKIIYLSLVGLCLCFYNGWSQGTAGVYITSEDFVSNKLADAIDTDLKENHLRENTSAQLIIKTGSTKKKYAFGEIYGYLSKGYKYRAVEKSNFVTHPGYLKVVDTTGLILYSQRIAMYKATHTDYYYSQSIVGIVKPLNPENLAADFGAFPEFIIKVKSLDSHRMLSKTGSKGTYLINELYLQEIGKTLETN